MKSKIKRLLSDPGALVAAAILVGIVLFSGYVGFWINTNIGQNG